MPVYLCTCMPIYVNSIVMFKVIVFDAIILFSNTYRPKSSVINLNEYEDIQILYVEIVAHCTQIRGYGFFASIGTYVASFVFETLISTSTRKGFGGAIL